MKVQCESCEATYKIPDEKIPAAEVKLRCLKCQNTILVDGRESKIDEFITESTDSSENELVDKTKGKAANLSEKATNLGKKAKEKAADFKEFANEKTSSYVSNSEKAAQFGKFAKEKASSYFGESDNSGSRLNRFLYFSFKIGKYISAFCIVLFFLAFIGSTIYYFTRFSASVDTPEFRGNQYQKSNYEKKKNYDFSKIDTRRNVQNEFDKIIRKIINLGFAENSYDLFVDGLSEIPEEYRESFIEGLYVYLIEGKKYIENNKTDQTLPKLLMEYDSKFRAEMKRVKAKNLEAKQKKWTILYAVGISLLMYMLFLLIPILIKIEENTRLKPSESHSDSDLNNGEFQSASNGISGRPAPPDSSEANALF